MPKNKKYWKSSGSSHPLSTKGRRLEDVEREEERKRVAKEKSQEELRNMVNLQMGLKNLVTTRFIFVHFSTHCRTHDDIVVPAEGAIVEMTLEGGIRQSWHRFLRPGPLPPGTRNECIAKARKTHNIPVDDETLCARSQDDDVLEDINSILCNERDLQTKPGRINTYYSLIFFLNP